MRAPNYVDGLCRGGAVAAARGPPDEEELSAVIQGTAAEREKRDLFAVIEQMRSYHPKSRIGTCRSLGSTGSTKATNGPALMAHALAPCDREQTLAYLEATNPEECLLVSTARV